MRVVERVRGTPQHNIKSGVGLVHIQKKNGAGIKKGFYDLERHNQSCLNTLLGVCQRRAYAKRVERETRNR